MKKLYSLLLIAVGSYAFGQTFYAENMGVPTGTTAIATYAGQAAPATFQNGAPIAYSGTGDMRATGVSTGYTGASGGGNVFMNADTEYFQIDGLNTSAYASADLQLSFGALTATQMIVEQSTNGTDWTALTFTPDAVAGWTLYTVAGGQIPSSTTLSLKFRVTGAGQTRLDDIKLSNVSASCTFAFGSATALCDAVTDALDTYTVSIPYTGAGNATYNIVTTAGTVGGDNPTSVAAGNIVITGVTEGVNITVTVTGGTCNSQLDVTGPSCKPVNALPYTEHFEYTAGTALGGTQKWSNVNSGDDITVTPGNLNYTGVPAFGNAAAFSGAGIDTTTPFTAVTSGTVYASFLMSVTDMTNITADPSETYFACLTEPNAGAFRARLFLKRTGTQYQLGFANLSTTTNYAAPLFNVGDVVFVVMGYDFGTNTLSCWLNPTVATFNASTPATLTDVPGTALTTLGAFLLRQDGAASTPSITVDALRIATTINELLATAQNDIAGFQMYPNPVNNGLLYITSDSNETKAVAIFDVLGKQVVNTTVTDEPVNVSALTSGVYIVKVTEAGKTATRKLVIK